MNESVYSYYTEATDKGDMLNEGTSNLEIAALDMDSESPDKRMMG